MTLKLGQIVTLEMLKTKKAACPTQLDIFNREWPLGCELNITNLEKAAALQLDIHWFAMSFLPYPLRKEYSQKATLLWKEDNQKVDLLWKEYCQKVALLVLNVLKAETGETKGG